jgi:hypothetical protein
MTRKDVLNRTPLAIAREYKLDDIIELLTGTSATESKEKQTDGCIVCAQALNEKYIAQCGHMVCGPCTKKDLQHCPICKAAIVEWLALKEKNLCISCLNPIETPCAASPCGHTLTCLSCTQKLTMCPVPGCKQPVAKWIKYFE